MRRALSRLGKNPARVQRASIAQERPGNQEMIVKMPPLSGIIQVIGACEIDVGHEVHSGNSRPPGLVERSGDDVWKYELILTYHTWTIWQAENKVADPSHDGLPRRCISSHLFNHIREVFCPGASYWSSYTEYHLAKSSEPTHNDIWIL